MSSIVAITLAPICRPTTRKRSWPISSISELCGDGGAEFRLYRGRRRSRRRRAGGAVGGGRAARAGAGRRRRPGEAARRSAAEPPVGGGLRGPGVPSLRFRKPGAAMEFLGTALREHGAAAERLALPAMLGRRNGRWRALSARQRAW